MGQAKFWRLAGITGIFIGGEPAVSGGFLIHMTSRCPNDLPALGCHVPEILYSNLWTAGMAGRHPSLSSFVITAGVTGPI